MKKLFLLCAVVLTGIVNAQESKGLEGAWWGMAQLQYSNRENPVKGGPSTSHFSIMPIVGTFVSPSVTVGAGVGYTSTKVGDAKAVNEFTISPLARKYWNLGDKFFIFGQAAAPMTFNENFNHYFITLSPGVDFFVNKHFTFEASFGLFSYSIVSPKAKGANSYGRTDLGFDTTNINFGLKYIF